MLLSGIQATDWELTLLEPVDSRQQRAGMTWPLLQPNKIDMEHCCSELPLSKKLVTVCRKRYGQVFVLENVPARVCQSCGERYFAAEVVQAMERLMSEPAAQTRTITVPVIALAV